MTYYYNIHDIVKIASNIPLSRILNSVFHRYFLSPDALKPDIIVNIGKKVEISKSGLSRHDLWFYGKEGEDFVYYEDKLFGVKDRILVQNIRGTPTEIQASKSVLRISPRSRGSISDLIETILDLKLLNAGYSTVHAACLSKNNSGILLAAFPNVGKTLSTLYLLQQGFGYLYDDTGIIDKDGYAYSYPSTSAIGYQDFLKFVTPRDIGRWNYYKTLTKGYIIRKSKIIERLFKPPQIDLLAIKEYEVINKSKVKFVCVLEIAEKKVKQIEKDKLITKIMAINSYSLPKVTKNPFMWVYAYFNNLDLSRIREREKEILSNFLDHCKCFIISCNMRDWVHVIGEVYFENEKRKGER